jgi:hypothetical protein
MVKAIDYKLGRSPAPIRFLDDGTLPIDNHCGQENAKVEGSPGRVLDR